MKAGKKSNAEAQRGGEAERTDRWPLVRLGDVCEVRAGADYKAVLAENGPYPIYGTGGEMGRASQWRCPANSVIVGRKGTLDNPMLITEPFWNIDTCFGVIPSESIVPEYLYRFCQNFDFYSLVPASGRPSTTSEAIRAITLPLPPLATQRAIVARLDSALARAGALEKRFAAIAQNAELSFKASLNEEFAGRTGGTGETSGTGGSSCSSDSSGSSDSRNSRNSSSSRNPSDPSKPWPLVRLGDVCEVITGNTPSKAHTEYYGGDIPFFKPSDLEQGANTIQAGEFLTEAGFAQARQLPENTVLVTCIGATLGKTGIIRKAGACNQQINALIPRKALPEYLYYAICSPPFQATLWSTSNATTLPIVNKSRFESLSIPLPPLSVQRAIVSRLDAARKRADGIAALARQAAEAAANLRKALLKEAFE